MPDLKQLKLFNLAQSYQLDLALQTSLAYSAKADQLDRLDQILKIWENKLPGWDSLAKEASRAEKLPRIDRFDHVGNAIEKPIIAAETKQIRREVVATGIFENNSQIEMFAKIYLLAQLGESGVTCPLACTDGLTRAVELLGNDLLKKKYLPLLKSQEYPLAGAQFITEQSGGSDVGAIQGVAKPTKQGHYLLTAEKWFCSAIDEFFLVAARPEGAPTGTKGIAIFFVPRLVEIDDPYFVNNLAIKRLKNKLGTQSLPTAEVDFTNAIAYPLGDVNRGFEYLMTYILNTSRIHNAANCLGFHRRAFVEARQYCAQRIAFDKPLLAFPLIQQSLLKILARHCALTSLFFQNLQQIDQHGQDCKDHEQNLWQRFLINLIKYRTAVHLTEDIKDCILNVGANGIVEDFSILPRLLRDSLIVETWEGPHNTLCLQIMRDIHRFDFFERLQNEINLIVDSWPENILPQARKIYLQNILEMGQLLGDNLKNKDFTQRHARIIVDQWAFLLEVGNLVKQALKLNSHHLLVLAALLCFEQSLPSLKQVQNPIWHNLNKLAEDLLWEKPIQVDLQLL